MNSLLQSQLFSSLVGVIIGGIITLVVTSYSISKQFTNQEKLNRQIQNTEKRRALLAIQQELSHNTALTYKAIDIMGKSDETQSGLKIPNGWIEFERYEWNNFKNVFFMATDDEDLISEISWLYYQFSVSNSTRILTKETAKEIIEVHTKIAAKLNDIISEVI